MKKIISIILIFSMVFSTKIVAFADVNYKTSDNSIGYARYNENNVVPYSEENVEKYENEAIKHAKKENSIKTDVKNDDPSNIIPYGEIYEDGQTKIDVMPAYTSGYTYEDGSQQSAILSNILNIVMTIGGYYMTTVQSIVADIATLCFGMSWSEVETVSPGRAILSHSYTYIDKLGKAYNQSSNSWIMKVDIQTRLTFRHEYAAFAGKDGYTRTQSYDFIIPNGYGPVAEEPKAYYYDNAFIDRVTYEYYMTGRSPYYDVYLYIY